MNADVNIDQVPIAESPSGLLAEPLLTAPW